MREPHEQGWSDRRVFAVAWFFWTISAALGVLLRLQAVRPVVGLAYGHVLHAHSHVAFLGWIFNAFFALALRLFVPVPERGGYIRLFLVTQIAVAGMLFTYPFTGYAAASISFSTLHMVCAGVWAWKLLRRNRAAPAARPFLWIAFGCMLLSGLGPLALGPLAALDLRESPWYLLSIYFYLHFQYNGWFVFFLLAVLLQQLAAGGNNSLQPAARRTAGWLAAGTVLTLALSALWLAPPRWVYVAALAGGAALLMGSVPLWHLARRATGLFRTPLTRLLAGTALAVLLVKHVLQFVAAWPGLALLAEQRFVVIGFLHLVFLGIVSPLLVAWGREAGWWRLTPAGRAGLGLLGIGFVVTQLGLFYPPLAGLAGAPPWPRLLETLLAGAIAMALGIAAMFPGTWQKR